MWKKHTERYGSHLLILDICIVHKLSIRNIIFCPTNLLFFITPKRRWTLGNSWQMEFDCKIPYYIKVDYYFSHKSNEYVDSYY